MIQVIVREQHDHLARTGLRQLAGDRAHPGSCVQNQAFALRSEQQQRGRIAAELVEAGPQGGLASSHTPDEKAHGHFSVSPQTPSQDVGGWVARLAHR